MKSTITGALAVTSVSTLRGWEASPHLEPMKSTQVFGQTIRYYDVGSSTGPALVLLHGAPGNALLSWGKVIEPLAAKHRVLAMDQIGFGASDKPGIDYRVQTYVDFLAEFLRQQQIGDFILVGVSFGGWVAAQYTVQSLQTESAASHAGKLPAPKKLILCDSGGLSLKLPPQFLDNLVPGSLAAQEASMRALVYDQSLVTDEAVRDLFISTMAADGGGTIRSIMNSLASSTEWIDGKLAAITIPTLLVWGVEDHIVPIERGIQLAAGIPNARLETIEKCGHAPMVEKPGEFLAVVDSFLQ
jgi:pimeloyl-ACP methyl ester carboxylesterase